VPHPFCKKDGLFCSDAEKSQTSLRKWRPALHHLQLRPEKRGLEGLDLSITKIEGVGHTDKKKQIRNHRGGLRVSNPPPM